MLVKQIIYCGEPCSLVCDGNCGKAWGVDTRPKNQSSADPDDFEYLSDSELGDAPLKSSTYEGGFGKPQPADAEKLTKWCARSCERSTLVFAKDGVTSLKDFSVRIPNLKKPTNTVPKPTEQFGVPLIHNHITKMLRDKSEAVKGYDNVAKALADTELVTRTIDSIRNTIFESINNNFIGTTLSNKVVADTVYDILSNNCFEKDLEYIKFHVSQDGTDFVSIKAENLFTQLLMNGTYVSPESIENKTLLLSKSYLTSLRNIDGN